MTWLRQTPELEHVIALLHKRGTYDVQWGVVSPDAVRYLWPDLPTKTGDVGLSVLSGFPGTQNDPAECPWFRLDDEPTEEDIVQIAAGLANDFRRIAQRIQVFSSRRDVRDYLLQNRDAKDRRDFMIPANRRLKLLVAAALAAVDSDPDAGDLIHEAARAWGNEPDARIDALRAARQGS